jgi:hypothetical protein
MVQVKCDDTYEVLKLTWHILRTEKMLTTITNNIYIHFLLDITIII